MDIVINYCDSSNEVWRTEYNTLRRDLNMPTNSFSSYFYKNSLKYLLRSIDKNLRFVKKVFIIVPDESHIPDYINQKKIKIVRHKDIIPKEYLPTFNPNTIEMFIARIDGLSDKFIYLRNENSYFLNKIKNLDVKKDYILYSKKNDKPDDKTKKIVFNEQKALSKVIEIKDSIIFRNNDFNILDKVGMWKLNTDICYDIYNSCTPFPNENKNYNIDLWKYYFYYRNRAEKHNFNYAFVKDVDKLNEIKSDYIAFSKSFNEKAYEKIEAFFEEKFPTPSKYEKIEEENIEETKKIETNTEVEIEKVTESVDFVFPYVNPNDPEWIKKYTYSSGEEYNLKDSRFRDFSVLKYLFRSIEKNAPWIRKVYMIVDSETQVPDFLNASYGKLKIVRHKDIIPKEYLPTFNSNTIEMFVPFINGLSEKFIYGNDDLLFMNKANYSDFFRNGKIVFNYLYRYKRNPKAFLNTCYRTWKIIEQNFGKGSLPSKMRKDEQENWLFIKQYHGCASPRLLSDCKECYNLFQQDINNSLSRFRQMEKNLNQYIYGYYSVAKEHYERGDELRIGAYFSKERDMIKLLNRIKECSSVMACINDTPSMTEDDIKAIYKILDYKFPEKSKFEI